MTCNKITKPEFTKEQIIECGKCKHASAKVKWCGLFGDWIGEHSRIIVPDKKIKYPSIATMGKSFIKAGAKHIASGMKERSEEEIKRILTICESCEEYVKKTGRCKVCGCGMKRKIKWSTTNCKLRKW